MNTIALEPAQQMQLTKDGNDGPLSRARQRRTAFYFFLTGAIGLLPLLLQLPPAWQAAGLGLVFPGAGFLAVGGWAMLLFPVTYLLYRAALFAWFGAGALAFPFLVWGLAAAGAAALSNGPIWPVAPYAAVALVFLRELGQFRKKRKALAETLARRDERNAYLAREVAAMAERAAAHEVPGERELTPEQLASVRYLLDRALQPVGSLEGFTVVDQFQTSALRYQLNSTSYALSLAQCHYTPSFHGYLSLAQRNMIEQMLERRIWGYWRWERLWGKFSLKFDPADEENIMLTGFYALQVCLYMGNTGDMRYAQPGSLTFKYNDRISYKHDIHTIVASLNRNYAGEAFCLFPCEPNWVYTPCNFMGLKSLACYDRLFGTQHFNGIIGRFTEKLDSEFTMADGSVYALRSNLTGFAVPFPFGDDGRSMFMSPIQEQAARVAWTMARHDLTYIEDGKLKIRLKGKGLDMGNYKPGHAGTLQNIMGGAREAGDYEVAETAQLMLDEMCKPEFKDGVLSYACSNGTNVTIARNRLLRRGDWRSAIMQGPPKSVLVGPLLTGADYPDVLVAKAFSDGRNLELVMYPGRAPGPQRIGIERLAPHGEYTVQGAEGVTALRADADGKASLVVHLEGRTAVTFEPAA
ncbi:MAG TPA: hypothetical protein VF774_21995 [Pseudoduganella sp.]|jgi:hypothetical protein